jgi:hypothetical protein
MRQKQTEKETIIMELSGWTNKILNPVSKNSELIGAGLALMQLYSGGGLQSDLQNLLGGHVHMPDFNGIFLQLKSDPTYPAAIIALLAGYLAKESGYSLFKKIGDIVIKGGSAYLAVRLGELVLNQSTHSDGAGSAGSVGGYSY